MSRRRDIDRENAEQEAEECARLRSECTGDLWECPCDACLDGRLWRSDLLQILLRHEDEIRAALEANPVRPGTWLRDSLDSPDPRGPARGVVAWLLGTLEPQ